ncbi:hypothetical protein JCM10449v2_001890 [Rhodotorula kratochvilovae]
MKVSAILAAAATLALPSVAHASSSHGPGAAHSRRFNRVLRSPGENEAPVVDLELTDADIGFGNASLVAVGDARDDGEEGHSLSKRGYSGRATFFAPGLGACGTYSSASDYIVAMNVGQYGDLGAVSSWCFKTISISYGGKTVNAQAFADESVGVFYMNWVPAGQGGGNNDDDKKSKEAAAAASSSSQAAAWASSSSAAAAWASSSSSRAAAWASSSSAANAAWLSSSSSSAAAAAASSASSAAAAAAASRVSAASVASVASVAAAASASDEALSIAAASAASVASVASAAAVSASLLPSATLTSSALALASATGVAKVVTPSIPAGAVGGNLDGIAQLVIAMGNVVAAQAAVAQSA